MTVRRSQQRRKARRKGSAAKTSKSPTRGKATRRRARKTASLARRGERSGGKKERVIGLFSDIHSNLEALQAVLEDMEEQGVTERICLGDIIGYNANPKECLQTVLDLKCPIVQGNHDREGSCNSDLSCYRDLARISMEHTRLSLSRDDKDLLQGLPLVLDEEEGFTIVHSSLFQPEEFFYVDSVLEAEFHFAEQRKPLCFCGHTHIARVYAQEDFAEDWGCPEVLHLEEGYRFLINVGSVGQPRDRDWRASYVIYRPSQRQIEYRRVQYDVGKTQQKISAAGLPAALGERILIGV